LRPTSSARHRAHAEIANHRELVQGGLRYVVRDQCCSSPQADERGNSLLPRLWRAANRSLDEMIGAPASMSRPTSATPPTSCCGNRSPASRRGVTGGHRHARRPGWHIECSAMAWKHLASSSTSMAAASIWCSPHHENELAQSCCAFHADRMANVWMHNVSFGRKREDVEELGNFSQSGIAGEARIRVKTSGMDMFFACRCYDALSTADRLGGDRLVDAEIDEGWIDTDMEQTPMSRCRQT